MAVRPIDAEKYMELLKEQYLHNKSIGNSQAARAWQGAIQLLYDMPTLTPPNEWVSVEERLPEDRQIVLFHQKDGFIYCAEHLAGVKDLPPAWLIDNDSWEGENITHWMALPAPPDSCQPEGEEDT